MPTTHLHPSIRNDGRSVILSWVKLVGVHPVPPPPARIKAVRTRPNNVESGTDTFGAETQGTTKPAPVEKIKPIRTKVRAFRVGGHRKVTNLVTRKSCILMATESGTIEMFAWPDIMPTRQAYRSRGQRFADTTEVRSPSCTAAANEHWNPDKNQFRVTLCSRSMLVVPTAEASATQLDVKVRFLYFLDGTM